MKLAEIKDSLKCLVLSKNFDPEILIEIACASDLMSDVLVSVKPGALLLTGLTNNQAIRTSKIAFSSAIVFVRGKRPEPETVELAETYQIPLLATGLSMFEACGILFTRGIKGIPEKK